MNTEMIIAIIAAALSMIIWVYRDRRELKKLEKERPEGFESMKEVYSETQKVSFVIFAFVLLSLVYWASIGALNGFFDSKGNTSPCGGRYVDVDSCVERYEYESERGSLN